MVTLITVFHVIACVFLILVVLLQAGKGGGVGAALGGGTSAQVFGGRGAGTFLERLTAGTAIVFMVTSMSLAYIASRSDSVRLQQRSVEQAEQKKKDDARAADDAAKKDADDRAKKDQPVAPVEKVEEPAAAPAAVSPKAETKTTSVAPAPSPKKMKTETKTKTVSPAPSDDTPKTDTETKSVE